MPINNYRPRPFREMEVYEVDRCDRCRNELSTATGSGICDVCGQHWTVEWQERRVTGPATGWLDVLRRILTRKSEGAQ